MRGEKGARHEKGSLSLLFVSVDRSVGVVLLVSACLCLGRGTAASKCDECHSVYVIKRAPLKNKKHKRGKGVPKKQTTSVLAVVVRRRRVGLVG